MRSRHLEHLLEYLEYECPRGTSKAGPFVKRTRRVRALIVSRRFVGAPVTFNASFRESPRGIRRQRPAGHIDRRG